jgi:mannose-6-phosphate isomerase-like protein (cupin superfamily)
MLKKLQELIVSGRLGEMLNDGQPWKSVDVTYDKPRVRRLWRPDGENRVCLHLIEPCGADEPFFHPHPWPSAMVVLSGCYEMRVGYGPRSGQPPPRSSPIILSQGSCYEMVDPDEWHSVRPLGEQSLSVMLSGPPYKDQTMPKVPATPQASLDEGWAGHIKLLCLQELTFVKMPGSALWSAGS